MPPAAGQSQRPQHLCDYGLASIARIDQTLEFMGTQNGDQEAGTAETARSRLGACFVISRPSRPGAENTSFFPLSAGAL